MGNLFLQIVGVKLDFESNIDSAKPSTNCCFCLCEFFKDN